MTRYRTWMLLGLLAGVLTIGLATSQTPLFADERDDDHWQDAFDEVEMIDRYLELMERFSAIADDSGKAAVMAIMTLEDHLEREQAVELLEDLLGKVEDDSVKRAIRVKLIDLYDEDSKSKVEQFKALILAEDD